MALKMKACNQFLLLLAGCCFAVPLAGQAIPSGRAIDAKVSGIMTQTGAKGMAIAVINHGKVTYVHAYGIRDAKGDPLTTDTIMYGASLTKAVFAYTVMRLVDEGKLNLDAPIGTYLDKPLTSYGFDDAFKSKYAPYKDLANDPRWKKITPRMCLDHSTGFNNFWFMEPDYKLRIHFEPGTRFSYSGDGFDLLQFVIEHGRTDKGLGLDVGGLAQATFDRLGMTRTTLAWVSGKDANVADGWNDHGQVHARSGHGKVRAAGSLHTTISDMAKFTAALVRGDGLTAESRAEMTRPTLHITTAAQFPTLAPELPVAQQRKDLYAGLGVIVFNGPEGRGFYKGGHDEQTANTMVCLNAKQRCVVVLSNDVRAEKGFSELVRFVLGDAGVPYDWEYGDYAGKS